VNFTLKHSTNFKILHKLLSVYHFFELANNENALRSGSKQK